MGSINDIVRRHGTYKRDLQMFAEALIKKKNPVFPELETTEPPLSHPAIQMMEDSIKQEEIETPFDDPGEDEEGELDTHNEVIPSASTSLEESDESFIEDAYDTFLNYGKVSAIELQRVLSISYVKAANIIEAMEAQGMVSKPNESGHRTLVPKRKSGPTELAAFHADEISKEAKPVRGRPKKVVPEIPEPVNSMPF